MSKAEKTEDVINVFNQLTSIRGQIESIKGQMKYFEESAALSAISVRLVAEETIQPIEVLGWKPEGTLRDAVQDLIYFWQDFVDFLIVFVVNWLPKLITIAAVFGLPIWLIVRAVRKTNRKRKTQQEAPKEVK
jgi:Flp pilus assembly protein TadB